MGTASEELEIKVLGGLYSVTEENLKKLLVHLEITATAVEGKTKRQVLKVARNAIEAGVQAAETENEAITYLKVIESYIFDIMPPMKGEETETLTEDTSNAEKISELEKSLADSEAEKEKQISSLKQQLESLNTQKNSSKPSVEVEKKQSETPLTQTLNSQTSLFRRELKISGTIGQPYETNKLSFISLIHQINAAEAKRYQETEIL